jgi:hypothetical protein
LTFGFRMTANREAIWDRRNAHQVFSHSLGRQWFSSEAIRGRSVSGAERHELEVGNGFRPSDCRYADRRRRLRCRRALSVAGSEDLRRAGSGVGREVGAQINVRSRPEAAVHDCPVFRSIHQDRGLEGQVWVLAMKTYKMRQPTCLME